MCQVHQTGQGQDPCTVEKSACPAAQGRGMFVRATRLEKGYHCKEPEEDGRRSFGRRSFG